VLINKTIIFVCLIILLQGCSSKFAYNNADWLSNWYIDDYLDLNDTQNRTLKKELVSALEWHRTTQLSQYKQQLLALSSDLDSLPISEGQWLIHFNNITTHWHRARNEVSLRSAKLAPLLDPTQVNYLFKKLHEKNQQKLDAFNDQTLEEYRESRFESMQEAIEDYLGSISEQQKQFALEFTGSAVITEQEWFDSKVALQGAMKAAFEDDRELSDQLYVLMINPDKFKADSLLEAYNTNRTLLVSMLHKLSASLSVEQVIHFKEEIADLIALIESIEVNHK
jgi:hypothetical protein